MTTGPESRIFYLLITETMTKWIVIMSCPCIPGATTVNNSLFTYDEGKGHSFYFDVDYVPIFFDQDNFVFENVTLDQQARDMCDDNKQCMFDIHTTGKLSVGMASKQAVESFVAVINDLETPGKNITYSNQGKGGRGRVKESAHPAHRSYRCHGIL